MTDPDYDTVLRAVGAALHNWSLIELQLSNLFSVISDPRDQRKAHAVFAAVLSFDARLAICDRLMDLEEADELEKEMWTKLSARISKYYRKRHELAHFTLNHGAQSPAIQPFYTVEKWAFDKVRYLSEEEIRERSRKFIELAQALPWFGAQAFQRRGPSQQPLEPKPEEPPLVPRLRELATQSLEERRQRAQEQGR